MDNRGQQISAFFERYEKLFNDSLAGKKTDTKSTADSFTEYFIESSPVGVLCAKNDDTFAEKIEEGFDFYKNIGTTGMLIRSKETQLLDEFHAMTKVSWRYTAQKDKKEIVIDFEVFYLLQTKDDQVKIFAYITGDEQQALKDNGLI